MNNQDAPRVFISYTHETAEHKAWVARLATDLRANGVDAVLDVWEMKLGSDVAAYMEEGIRDSDRVLLICTEAYYAKTVNKKGGVAYEHLVVSAEVAESVRTEKFICILRSGDQSSAIPLFVRNRLFLDFREDQDYESRLLELVRDIHTAPEVPKPPLGNNPFISASKEKPQLLRTTDVATGEPTSEKPPIGANPLTPDVMAALASPVRRHLPLTRMALTHKFEIAGHVGVITVGLYPDGRPGELLVNLTKEGGTIGGLMDSFATLTSLSLQYGVPFEQLVKTFAYQRFEPSGFTTNPDIRTAYSIIDYIFRWLGCEFIQGYREATSPDRNQDEQT